jgi:DNA-binding NtrC family response regulator
MLDTSDLKLDDSEIETAPRMEKSTPEPIETIIHEPAPFYGLVDTQNSPLLTLEELTNRYLLFALSKNSGAKDKTARDLGIDRKTLYRRLHEMNGRRPESSVDATESMESATGITQ